MESSGGVDAPTLRTAERLLIVTASAAFGSSQNFRKAATGPCFATARTTKSPALLQPDGVDQSLDHERVVPEIGEDASSEARRSNHRNGQIVGRTECDFEGRIFESTPSPLHSVNHAPPARVRCSVEANGDSRIAPPPSMRRFLRRDLPVPEHPSFAL